MSPESSGAGAVRRYTAPFAVAPQRVRIVLLAAEGVTNVDIAWLLGMDRSSATGSLSRRRQRCGDPAINMGEWSIRSR
jgi:hypothetical protein